MKLMQTHERRRTTTTEVKMSTWHLEEEEEKNTHTNRGQIIPNDQKKKINRPDAALFFRHSTQSIMRLEIISEITEKAKKAKK